MSCAGFLFVLSTYLVNIGMEVMPLFCDLRNFGYDHIFCGRGITFRYMLRKQRQKGTSMHRFTKPVVSLRIVVALLAIVVGTTLFFSTSRARPALAASA